MRSLLFNVAALIVVGTAACARAEQAKLAEPISWTGLYVGGGMGTKRAASDWTTPCIGLPCQIGGANPFFADSSSPRRFETDAFRVALFGGYNWQLSSFVVGVEADLGLGSKSRLTHGIPGCTTDCGNLPPTPVDIDSASVSILRDWSLRGRAGYLVMPTLLAYGTAGIARQTVEANVVCSFAGPWCFPPAATDILSEPHRTTMHGWTAGGGIEWLIYGHWLVRGEYRYSNFGHFRPIFFSGTGNDLITDIAVVTHITTFGIAYKF